MHLIADAPEGHGLFFYPLKRRISREKAMRESAAIASVNALTLRLSGSVLRKNRRQLRRKPRAATVAGLRLRVLSSKRQASLRQ